MRKLAVVVVLACLAACSHSPTQHTPVKVQTLAPLRELTAAEAGDLTSLPWTVQGSPAGTGQIDVSVGDTRCFDVVGARVEVSASAQTVGVYGRRTDCSSAPGHALAVVQLAEPATAKPVRHAPAASPSASG